MKFNKVFAVYFSPTGNSKKCALAVAASVGRDIEEIDLTSISSENTEISFGINDFVVFAAPVYGGRLYKGFAAKIKNLKGNLAKCAVIVTYGNRHYDDALLEFRNSLIEQDFIPLGAAAIVGRHTYGEIQVTRPDEGDMNNCRQFGKDIIKKIDNGIFTIPDVPGNFPYKDGGNGGKFYPHTNDKCIKCGLCERRCPQKAIYGEEFEYIDKEKCISCFRCIRICPFGAMVMETEEYKAFAKMFAEKLSQRREDETFL